jgi:hypothetical protein
MRKSEWVDEGSIVLVGVRELSNATSKAGEEVADVLTLVPSSLYGKLKKTAGVNLILFSHVEKEDPAELANKIRRQQAGEPIEDDDIFDRDDDSDEEEEEYSDEEAGLTGEERQKLKKLKREEKQKKQEQKIAEARKKKQSGGGEGAGSDLDIDKI